MRKNVMATTLAVVAVIGVFSLLATLHAQPGPRDQLLLAVAQGEGALSLIRIEGKTLTPIKTLPVGKGAREVCVAPDGRRAYVSNDPDSTITAIDLDAQKVIATIALPGIKRPDGCAESPDGKKLYVAGMESGNVAIVSTQTNQLLKTVEAGKEPRRFVFTPDGRRLYVTSEDAKTIRIMDAASDKIADSFESGGQGPRILVPLPDQKTLLVANVDDDSASFIDIATKKINLTIGVGGSPQRVEISRDGAWAYVLSVIEQKVSVIDLKGEHVRAKKFVTIGRSPYGMAMSEDGSLLFVTSGGNNEIAAYDTSAVNALPLNTALAQLPVVAKVTLNRPMGLAIRPSAR
jgi:YVTN family beta-propeller protein